METPYFLVALPHMQDSFFTKTVVLIGHHNTEGAVGVVLNNPLFDENRTQALMTAEVRDAGGNLLMEYHEEVFEGGPVEENALFVLHNVEELGDEKTHLGEGFYLGSDAEILHQILEKSEYKEKRRFFLGCASWEKGQLDSELRAGAWLAIPLNKKLIFENFSPDVNDWQEHYWRRVLSFAGCDPLTLMSQESELGVN